MNPRRAVLLVEVDLDPIPGFGHTPGSWRNMIEQMLKRAAGHYNPTVTIAPAAPAEPPAAPDQWETYVQHGHQTLEAGWVPEVRGIKYASHQRTIHLRAEDPVPIDHWTFADHRHPVEGCQFCADLAARGELARTTESAIGERIRSRMQGLGRS